MKACVELTATEELGLNATLGMLRHKLAGTQKSDWFENYRKTPGYAHYRFEGTITDKLVELLGRMPTVNELIMIVDNGYGHFGAVCYLNGRFFNGKVNTD